MAKPVPLDTGLTREQVLEAFRRALNDMTDEQINTKFTEISGKISSIEERLTVLETEKITEISGKISSIEERLTALETGK